MADYTPKDFPAISEVGWSPYGDGGRAARVNCFGGRLLAPENMQEQRTYQPVDYFDGALHERPAKTECQDRELTEKVLLNTFADMVRIKDNLLLRMRAMGLTQEDRNV